MNKILKTGVIVCVVSVIFVVGLALMLTFLGRNINPESQVFDDVTKYEELMGKNGTYHDVFAVKNSIFPLKIAESAEVETFMLEYKQPYDGKYNYMAYLVYTCDEDDFNTEYARLSAMNITDEELYKDVYGITDFEHTLLAVYADEDYGVVYALCMEKSRRFVYFGLNFDKYYTDIEYSQKVNKDCLPNGFNAYLGNNVYEKHRK